MRVHKIAELPAVKAVRQCQHGAGHLIVDKPIVVLEVASDNHNGFTSVMTFCQDHAQFKLEKSTGDPRVRLNEQ